MHNTQGVPLVVDPFTIGKQTPQRMMLSIKGQMKKMLKCKKKVSHVPKKQGLVLKTMKL